ncbi:epigen-like isoform X1 [Xyrauchen texanus]|uniref:epigen-like isoform X1 n=1 Tax=Xyrauchen texanus TaxID=154827 RepID=UPI0022425B93|nr:epigen-like isoform X1 [Xyrauchen texanus]
MPQQVDKRCLHHAVLGMTLVLTLLYGRGDTMEVSEDVHLFNTTLNQLYNDESVAEPKVLAIQTPCGPEHDGFCFNGVCSYSSDLDTPICRCHQTYTGVRCEHMILDTKSFSSTEEVIGIICGVVLFLGTLLGLLYCCLKKRCRKSSPPYKNYGSENSV